MLANSLISKGLTFFNKLQYTAVRFRYHSEKLEKGPIIKRYGYKEQILQSGTLPRSKDARELPIPIYAPKQAWTVKRALFGQNDYIDILGKMVNLIILIIYIYSSTV